MENKNDNIKSGERELGISLFKNKKYKDAKRYLKN